MNFGRYPASVEEVEPEPYLRAKAQEAALAAPVRVTVIDGVADALPLEDRSFDAAVASSFSAPSQTSHAPFARCDGCSSPTASCASSSMSA
jgi:hypothetical protein